jgi:hypothetical protein
MSELTIKFKSGVNARALRPEILTALFDAAEIYAAHGFVSVVTSANDSGHKEGSLHYKNLAVDLRTNFIANPATKTAIRNEIAARLGKDYDVILHGEGANNHLHIEWDPK